MTETRGCSDLSIGSTNSRWGQCSHQIQRSSEFVAYAMAARQPVADLRKRFIKRWRQIGRAVLHEPAEKQGLVLAPLPAA